MTKNWTIIRAILLRLEAASTPNTFLNAKDVAPFPEQDVAYNMRLLQEAGYINAKFQESSSGDGRILSALAKSLTNAGHELLDTIRSDTIWGKVQETFKTKGLDMTFDLVMAVGKKAMETLLLS